MPLRACVFQDFKSTGDGLQKDSLVVIDTLKELGYEVHLCSLRSPNMEGARRNFGKELKVSSVTIPRFIFHSNRLNLIRSAIVHVDSDRGHGSLQIICGLGKCHPSHRSAQ